MIAEIVAIGTELLMGQIADSDAQMLSRELQSLGIAVYHHQVVGDNPQRMREALALALSRSDLVITTGGLGPTQDDLSKEIAAELLGLPMEFDPASWEAIGRYFERTGRFCPMNNRKQAMFANGCTILPNDCGTAPGCIIEDGPVRVVMLPGPPRECVTMLRNYVMPYLQKLSGAVIRSHMIRFFGIGESAMETRLRSFMDGANPTVAPYSREGECWVRVTAKGANEQECEALMEPVIEDICDKMGDLVYGIDCASLEERVLQLLQEKNTSLAVAESCTGGLLAQRITDIPGASAHFLGGVVTYTEDAKVRLLDMDEDLIAENGVVSMPVAAKMAKRVRKALGSDIGIGITGWAGPDGDDVGLVFVALASRGGCFVRRLQCGHAPRSRIRLIAASNALDMIRRYLTGLDV